MKKDTPLFFFGAMSGAIGALLFLLAIEFLFPAFLLSANISTIDDPSSESYVMPERTPSEPDLWQSVAANASQVLVSVQAFRNSQVVRFGTGSFVSQDGLLITTYDVAPDPAFIYQVSIADKVYRASLLERSYSKNLSILRIQDNGLTIAPFVDLLDDRSGKDLLIIGKLMQLSDVTLFSQRALLSHRTYSGIVLDTARNIYISGSVVSDVTGDMLGIVSIRGGTVRIISAETITTFINEYLEK